MFESSSGRFPNVYDSFRSGTNSTSMIENLQAQLKQRDGEWFSKFRSWNFNESKKKWKGRLGKLFTVDKFWRWLMP